MRDSSEKNMPRVATKQQATWAASKGKAAGIGGVKKNKRKKNNPAKMVAKAQKGYGICVKRAPMRRFIHETLIKKRPAGSKVTRITGAAVEALHLAAEAMAIEVLEDAQDLACRVADTATLKRGHCTVLPKHMKFCFDHLLRQAQVVANHR